MNAPLEIHFRGVAASSELESTVRQGSQRLEGALAGALATLPADAASCRVLIGQVNKPLRPRDAQPMPPAVPKREWPFVVRVDLAWPGHQLAVSRVHGEDPGQAAREAFSAMKRRLDGVARRERSGP